MRIEHVNTRTGAVGGVDLPPGMNPVRVGHHPKCHVVLPAAEVGPEAVALYNDAARGTGWEVWNRADRPLAVDGTPLTGKNQVRPVRGSRVTIDCPPFVLTVLFTADETAGAGEEADRLDRAAADLVRQVHKALLDLHPNDPPDHGDGAKDEYVHRLEQEIADLAAARPDFPTADAPPTSLGLHLAGVAVRSAVIYRLSAHARTGPTTDAGADGWGRYRAANPPLEDELAAVAAEAAAALGLADLPDLTAQVAALDAGFWPHWTDHAAPKLTSRTARYFALRRLVKEVKAVWFGFGPLEDLLDDPTVSEIMVVRADLIFVEKNGHVERSGRRFLTDPVTVIQRVMALAHRQINAAQPLADARLADGSRVNAVIDPLAVSGPCLTIRRFPRQRLTVDDLVGRLGSLSPAARDFLRAAVVNRRNLLIAGGTGTGKTTMLNCLSGFIPEKERIVTVEDTAELQLQKPHVVTLQARPRNVEGAGLVSIRDLVRNALRMRPDRIVVGECRGGEAIDMLQAMNTGHDGSMTTLHANTPDGVIRRLEVLVQQDADSQLPVETIHRQIVSAVDLIVQLGVVVRLGRKEKVVTEVTEVTGYDGTGAGVRLVPLFARDGTGPLAPTGHLPSFLPALIADGLVPDPVAFVRGGF